MKTFKIKNYKGNIVESLSKFQESHKDMKIVEAIEEGDTLKITVNEGSSYVGARYIDSPTLDQLVNLLVKFQKTYPELKNKKIYAFTGKEGAEPYVFDDDEHETSFGVRFNKFEY